MWTITQSESGYHVIHDDDGQYLVAFQSEDVARRVVASVNACVGLTVAQLESMDEGSVLGLGQAAFMGLETSPLLRLLFLDE